MGAEEILGQLHACRADRSGSAVDENPPILHRACLAQARQREARTVADRGRLVEAHLAGMGATGPRLRMHVVRVRAPALDAEDPLTDFELGDGGTDRLHLTRELHPSDRVLRPEQAGEAGDEGPGAAKPDVGSVDRRRVEPDEDLVVVRDGALDLLEPQHLAGPYRSYTTALMSAPAARTTVPVFCCVSTSLVASITSSKGYDRSITAR